MPSPDRSPSSDRAPSRRDVVEESRSLVALPDEMKDRRVKREEKRTAIWLLLVPLAGGGIYLLRNMREASDDPTMNLVLAIVLAVLFPIALIGGYALFNSKEDLGAAKDRARYDGSRRAKFREEMRARRAQQVNADPARNDDDVDPGAR